MVGKSCLLILGLLLVVSSPAWSRSAGTEIEETELEVPPDWLVRPDKDGEPIEVSADQESADIWFVSMSPGWHITTGPRAIFYHPGNTAAGDYRIDSTLHLFDPEDRNEAFGVFLGGVDLGNERIAYDYFLIRNSGEFLIKRREGTGTATLVDWTADDGIATFGSDSEGAVENSLAIEVGTETVSFLINGVEVASLPRSEVRTEGFVGLRVNHRLNLHVSNLSVTASD